MVERGLAAVLSVLFACFLVIASIDFLHLVADHRFGDFLLLLFCVIASVGWVGFLGALALAGAGNASSFRTHADWRPAIE